MGMREAWASIERELDGAPQQNGTQNAAVNPSPSRPALTGLDRAWAEIEQELDAEQAPAAIPDAPAAKPVRPAAIPSDANAPQRVNPLSGNLATAQATNQIFQQAIDDFSLKGIADWVKTTGKRLPERGATILAAASEGAYRLADPIMEKVEEKIPAFGYSIKVDRNGLSLLSPEERGEVQGLFEWAPQLRSYAESLGVDEGIAVGELADKPYKVVPFIVENVVASLPDMAWAAANTPTYIATRTNEIINDRLENDQKTIEDLTVKDVAAAAVAATIEGTLERYATRALGRATEAATAGGRIAKQTALQSTTEGIEEGAAYLGGAAGTERGVDPKALGEQVIAGAIVGGGLGAAVDTTKEVYSALPSTQLRRALDTGLDRVDAASPVVASRSAVRALDPNSYDQTLVDPRSDRPADTATLGEQVRAPSTAVTPPVNTPDQPSVDLGTPINTPDQEPPLADQTGVIAGAEPPATDVGTQPAQLQPVSDSLIASEEQLLRDLDQQAASAQTAVQQTVPDSLVAAIESMKSDLQVDAADTLNVTEVTNNTRLNRFKNALQSAFGVNVHFVDFGEQLTTASGRTLGAFNGYRSGDTILVGAKDVDFLDTTWHELTHVLETRHADVYNALRDKLIPNLDPGIRERLVASLNAARQQEVGRDLTEAELDSELVAYAVGDLVRSPETLGQMFDSFEDPAVAKTFRDVLSDILAKLLTVIKGPQYIKERARLVEAQKAVTTAFAEFQKRETQKQMAGAVTVTDPSAADANTNFARRVKPPPTKTVKAYKLFRVDPKQPGKLFPLFVNSNDPINLNEWLDAESGPSTTAGKVKSKIGALAYRPGWHAGDLPIATHIGSKSNPALKKPDLRPDNQVWAEVELAADRDWQSVANQRGMNAQGQVVPVRAQITDQLPEDGFYRYKTNPNMKGDWMIGGSMKVNRILSDTEVDQINRAAGTADLRRAKPFNPAKYGLDRPQNENAPAPTAAVAATVAQQAPLPRALPAKPESIEADESASYKRAAGQFSRDTQITGKFAGDTFMRALDESPQEMVEAYLNAFGREINTDYARELSPIYQSNPAIYAAYVHEAASKLSKMAFDSLLQSAGPNDVVRFTAGGGGSGKGYALSKLSLLGDNIIIFDGTLSKLSTATTLLDKSLNAGVATEIYYVNADAMWAFGNALKRATTKGRTVPIEALAEAHAGAGNVARQLLEQYAGSAPLRVVNNTPNGVSYGTIGDIPRYNVSELKERMYEELDRRVKDGFPIGLAIGFAPDRYSASAVTERPAERDAGPVREPVRDGVGAPPRAAAQQPNQPAEQAEAVTPSVAPETIPDAKQTQPAELNRFRLNVRRAERQSADAAELSTDELSAITKTGVKLGVPREVLDRLTQQAIETKRRFPVSQGWAPLFLRGVMVPKNKTAVDAELNWEPIPYKYNVPDGVGRAPNKINEQWADQVSEEFYKLIKQIYGRAMAGDRNANVILSHKNWYRNVTEVLRREFGAAGDLLSDLLGATSPNTPVDTNWRFSIDIMRRFVRGDFNAEMKAFTNYVADGGKVGDYPAADKIKQISGKLYGMNSTNAMLALADTWRQIHPGQAPKARNFALNLIGQSDMATIDVWAARMLRRAASALVGKGVLDRVPPPAEKGVSGDWNAKATAVGGEFGFGAQVMETVAKRLRDEGIDVTAPDLQAIAWFAEKELWAKNGWTSAQGEGGSFEENLDAMPMERFIAGWSVQQGEVVPDEGTSSAAQARVLYTLRRDDSVVAARVMPTKGLYGGTVEQSFDTEWTVERGKHDPSLVLAEIAQIAKENSQYDIFVSKVLLPEENSANARPGVEIYFRDQRALNNAMPVLERFTSQGVDGFTMAVDPRAQDGQYIGVRLQYVPEISMRWDEQFRADVLTDGFLGQAIAEKTRQLNKLAGEVSTMDGVAFAKRYDYDTVVVGTENYDEYINRAASGGDSRTGERAWFGQPVRAAVERAAARLNRDAGEIDGGGLQDASRPEPDNVGQFSRRLVELAANQEPSAPKLFGISETPTVLRAIGGPRELLVMEPRNVAKVVNPQLTGRVTEEGGMRRNAAGLMVPAAPRIPLTVDELRAIPQQLADPVAIIKQESNGRGRRYGYRFIVDSVKDGYPVVAVLHPGVRYGNDQATELVSVYPVNEASSLEGLNRELNSAQLLYFNKGKATVLASKIGKRLPSLPKVTPTLAKNPGTVPNRTLPAIERSNFARRVTLTGDRFNLPERTLFEKYMNSLLNNQFQRVEDVQRAVVAQGGTTERRDAAGNLLGDTDIARAKEARSNATAAKLEDFRDTTLIPLIDEAARLGVSLDDVGQFMYAMYAPERNAIIQQRNPTQFGVDGGSGMTNAEARQIVADLRARPDFAAIVAIAQRFRAINNKTLQLLETEGLVESQVIAQWRRDNPNYVPLRGFEDVDEKTGESLGAAVPGRLDPRNPFVKTAKGRTSRAANVLENIIKDYEDAVVLAGKNEVNRLLLKFVTDNPDPKLWAVNKSVARRTYRKGSLSLTGTSQGQVSVTYDVDDSPANTIAVRVRGRPVYITITDPAMLQQMQDLPSFGNEEVEKLFAAKRAFMRFLSKTLTSLNPTFTVRELFRSTEQALLWNATKYGAKDGAGKAFLKLMKSSKAAFRAQRGNSWQGNSDTITIPSANGPVTITTKQAYEMFKEDGGKFSFLDIRNVEDIGNEIRRRFEQASAGGIRNWRTYHKQVLGSVLRAEEAIVDFVSASDNVFRFATYMARLEAGDTRQQAADAARNVTLNYARKGRLTPYLSPFYLFFHPAVKGLENTYRAVFKTKWRGYAAIGSLAALGYAIAEMNMSAIGDDDEPYWDKELYKGAKIRNAVIFNSDGDTMTIPAAYGWGFFMNVGMAIHDLERGVPVAKVAAFLRDSFFTHFSPLGSFENPGTFFAPTVVDPFVIISNETTDQGLPLMPKQEWSPDVPDSERFFESSRGTYFQRFARWLNEQTRGSENYPGHVSISPETMRYLVSFAFGGLGSFVRDTSDSVSLSSELGFDRALEKNKIPILRSFFQKNTGRQNMIEFYRNKEEALIAMKRYKKSIGTDAEFRSDIEARMSQELAMAQLGGSLSKVDDALSNLRKEEIDIVEKRTRGEIDPKDADQQLQEIADKKNKVYVDFNREFYSAKRDKD